MLVWAVEGVAAGAQIWAGQALPGQYGPVGAAACHAHKGLYTGLLRGELCVLYEPGVVGQNLVQHVPVAVVELDRDGALAVLLVEALGRVEHELSAHGQLGRVVVAQQVL